MKKALTMLLIILMVSAFLAGCQATPDAPVVIQKDMEQMIEKAQETSAQTPGISLREQTGAPETLVLESTEGNFTLSVDAVVSVPDAYSMPIIRVKAGEFSQEQVTDLWDALVGDNVLLRRQSSDMTKDELEPLILTIRQNIAEYDSIPYHTETIEQMKEELESLEAQYNSAPEEIEMVQADSTLRETEYENEGTTYMSAGGYSEGNTMDFQIKNAIKDSSGYTIINARLDFYTDEAYHNFGQVGTIAVDGDTQLNEDIKQYISTTPAEAKRIVEDLCTDMGMPMEVYSMELMNDEETGIYDDVVAPAANYAYKIECNRVVEGNPVAMINGGTYLNQEGLMEYSRQWLYEELEFLVNDSGIISMVWSAPLEIGEVKVQDSALLPFSDIQSTFEKMMRITYEAQAKDMENLACNISNVRLEMMRIDEQGSIENGLLVPAWNFYGTDDRTYTEGEANKSVYQVLLCINAIDGSAIDPHKGY
ncbi:MAG: DUF6034 family protein [Eubacteriales bacterium]|nr:DUF6034 family protein [Eubacteriales bacterium]